MLNNFSELKYTDEDLEARFLMSDKASFAQVKEALCHFVKVVCILEDQAKSIQEKKQQENKSEPELKPKKLKNGKK